MTIISFAARTRVPVALPCYVLTLDSPLGVRYRSAARQLARLPIDEDWSHPWESGLRIISVTPNPVAEVAVNLGGSLLEADRQATKGRHRSVVRSLHGGLMTLMKNARANWWQTELEPSDAGHAQPTRGSSAIRRAAA